jgi:hypothetical protein
VAAAGKEKGGGWRRGLDLHPRAFLGSIRTDFSKMRICEIILLMTREEDLKIVYSDAVELHNQQQASLDLIYNKFNWILVSDVVLLGAMYSVHRLNILIVFVITLSAVLSLIGFESRKFKITEKISTQLVRAGNTDFLEGLIEKKRLAFEANASQVTEITNLMKYSSRLLILALALQCLLLILR